MATSPMATLAQLLAKTSYRSFVSWCAFCAEVPNSLTVVHARSSAPSRHDLYQVDQQRKKRVEMGLYEIAFLIGLAALGGILVQYAANSIRSEITGEQHTLSDIWKTAGWLAILVVIGYMLLAASAGAGGV